MKLDVPGEPHLTYCTNIHPGESWPDVHRNLEHGVAGVKRALGVPQMGVGLRLSARAAQQLAEPREIARLQALLEEQGLYVFTLNGFPYGPFHGRPIKAEVYQPDWRTPERLAYSNLLAELCAELVPRDLGGSVSTVPGAFRGRARCDDAIEAIAANLLSHALYLDRLRDESGVSVALALEPEPACLIETTDEAVAFFERWLLGASALARVAAATGRTRSESEVLIRRHLGVCLDACHAAVEFEDPLEAVERLERADIAVRKLQLSVGLRVPRVGRDTEALLRPFEDPVYLHQVVESAGGALRRHVDLPDAFEALRARGDAAAEAVEWRIHFHVPIHLEPEPPLGNTQDVLARLLERQRTRPFTTHLEVETYTWDVLPESHRSQDRIADIAAELRWVRDRLVP